MTVTVNGVDYENHRVEIIDNQACLVVAFGEKFERKIPAIDDERPRALVISLTEVRNQRRAQHPSQL